MTSPWIQTVSGVAFDLLEPTPDMVRIEDIAHALSYLCRYTGHVPSHYSVAQHSVLAAEQVAPEFALDALMHDSPEAYVGDVSAPLKRAMRAITGQRETAYDEIEHHIGALIAKRYSLRFPHPPEVKTADMRMLATEKAWLGKEAKPWELGYEPYDIDIVPWPAALARSAFLAMFERLGGFRR